MSFILHLWLVHSWVKVEPYSHFISANKPRILVEFFGTKVAQIVPPRGRNSMAHSVQNVQSVYRISMLHCYEH